MNAIQPRRSVQPVKNLTEEQALAVYAILVATAGARTGDDCDSFVIEFTGDRPTNEWRFIGSLGFGGKFRFPRLSVDCYPEHQTPARLDAIKHTNERLSALRTAWGWGERL